MSAIWAVFPVGPPSPGATATGAHPEGSRVRCGGDSDPSRRSSRRMTCRAGRVRA